MINFVILDNYSIGGSKILIANAFVAAKLLIAAAWKSKSIPLIKLLK